MFPLAMLIALFTGSAVIVPVTLAQQFEDNIPPQPSAATINGATLTLTFSETLDPGSIPSPTAFEVTVTAPGQAVSSMPKVTGVALGGATVTLTLDTSVRRQDTVTLAYTKPQTEPLKNPVNLPVSSFTGQNVANNTPGAVATTLSGLALSGIAFTPAFSSGTTEYTADVGNDIDHTTVTATPTDPASTVDVSPGDADPDTDGHQVIIEEGPNTVTATVMPEDTTATTTAYTITVTRGARPPDTTGPALVTSSASGATLTLGYDERLDENSIPRRSSFIVAVNGHLRTVSAVAVNGTELRLNLNPAVEYGDVLTLTYTVPTGGDVKPLRNLAGLAAPAIPAGLVDNGTPDPTPPELGRVSVTGDTLTLVYDEHLDTESVPATAAFTVSGNSSTVSAVSTACRTVTLTLNSPVAQGDNLTLSYTVPTGEDSYPIRNLAGLTAPAISSGPVVNDGPDATPPSPAGASVLGEALTVKFDEDLDENSVPEHSAFTVTVNEAPRAYSGLFVRCNYITLSLGAPVEYGDDVILAYTAPTGDGESPIQDLAGLPAAAISSFSASNETPDTTPPVLARTSVNQAELTLTYDEALYEDFTPPPAAFTVAVNDAPRTLSSVSVSGTDVILTLSPPAEHGDAVTLAYAVPSGGSQASIRNRAGLPAEPIPNMAVSNDTPDTTPPTLISASVAGNALTLTYDKDLDAGSKPTADGFTVKVTDYVANREDTASVTAIDLTGKSVTLTLDYHVRFGDAVSLVYSRGDNPIRDTRGNQAANIGTTESPHSVVNSSAKGHETGVESVMFSSINTERTYTVPKASFGQALTVGNEDDQLEVSVTPSDPRAQISSIQWRDKTGDYHSTGISGGNARVTLPRYGDGQSNYNIVKIDITSEAGADSQTYYFKITRKADRTAPSLTSATVEGTSLTLTYNEGLDEGSTPHPTDFAVTVVDSVTNTSSPAVVSNVTVDGMKVVLTLAQILRFGDTITLKYTRGDNPIEDPGQNPAVDLSDHPVSNETAKATINTLKTLSLSGITLNPTFAPATTNYTATVPHETVGTTVSATPADPRATATIASTGPDDKVSTGHEVILKLGKTVVMVAVTPEDSSATQKVYTVTVTRPRDAPAPGLVSATANGPVISLTYNGSLDPDSVPGNEAFSVTVNESARGVANVSITGSQVALTVNPAVEHGDSVALTYTPPTGPGANPLQDIAGNPAAAIEDGQVQNNTPDTTPPELISASVNSAILTLLFDKELDQNSIPASTDFTIGITDSVTNSRPPVAVTKVAILGNGVTLTLDHQARFGDTVSLIYARGGNPIQDTAENQAANAGSAALPYAVTNSTAKSGEAGIESVRFESIISDTTYEVPKADMGKVLTVKHTDGRLDVTVNLTDTRAQVNSIQWRDLAGDYQSTNLQEGNTQVTLPIHGAGPSNHNKVKIEVESESGDTTRIYNFDIARESQTTAPRPTVSTVNGAMLIMVFDETLDPESIPEKEAFDVVVNGEQRAVPAVAITGAGVVLTLAPPVEHGDAVVLTYTVPTGDGASPIRDLLGEIAPDIRFRLVENQTPDTTPPELSNASVDGVTLTLTYNETLNDNPAPAASGFTINVTDSVTGMKPTATVTGVVVSGQTVTLTLDYEVRYADTVTIVYVAGPDPIQDTAGNSAADIGAEQTPHSIDNPTGKSTRTGYAAVIFRSINSDRTYEVTEPGSSEFTVLNEDEFLEVDVGLVDRRSRTKSIEWFDSSANEFRNDGDIVRLRLQGAGPSNHNRVRISLLSEAGGESVPYEFQITRETGATPLEFIGATVTGDTLTLTYSETLDRDSMPAGSDFSVTVVDSATGAYSTQAVSAAIVEDRFVILILDTPTRFGDEVTLTYTKGANPIRDAIGNAAADLHNESVTNETLQSTANTLNTLSLRGLATRFAFAPVFHPAYPNYAATVPSEITQTTVAAATTDQRAKFRITPEDGDEKTAGHQVALDVGETTITVAVTPENLRVATGMYTVTVTRLPDATPPTLVSATVNGTMLTLDYDELLERGPQLEAGDFTVDVGGL